MSQGLCQALFLLVGTLNHRGTQPVMTKSEHLNPISRHPKVITGIGQINTGVATKLIPQSLHS